MDVKFDYLSPSGIMIRACDESSRYLLQNVLMQKVRCLAEECSPVVLRGFKDTTDTHTFEAKA